MVATANYGFITPGANDDPDGPAAFFTLASGIDTALKAEETARLSTVITSRRTNTAGTSLASGANPVIPFPTQLINEIPWDATNNQFVIPTNGYYTVAVGLSFAANATGVRLVRIVVDGANLAINQSVASVNTVMSVGLTETLKLNANSVLQITAQQSSGAALALATTQGYNFLSLTRVGRA